MWDASHLDEAKRKPSAKRWLYVASRNTATARSSNGCYRSEAEVALIGVMVFCAVGFCRLRARTKYKCPRCGLSPHPCKRPPLLIIRNRRQNKSLSGQCGGCAVWNWIHLRPMAQKIITQTKQRPPLPPNNYPPSTIITHYVKRLRAYT